MAQLFFYRDGREVLRFPLNSDEVRLGRHSDNDISLPDPEISRFHARVFKENGTYCLENLSRVGTSMSGKNIDLVKLSDQDVFDLGAWRILFEMSCASDEAETAIYSGSNGKKKLPQFCGIIGKSPLMQQVFTLIEKGSECDLPVMIQGETGTGKELVAQALHKLSGRKGSFVALNCGAISPNLIESELFGHERGAFTGAVQQHRGAFEQARGGTLFLDEIGELPLELQPKLLRVLEEGTFKRVGGVAEMHADVRIVGATHRDLHEEIGAGRFREDLFYRLMGLPIQLPALRERSEDIPILARYFVQTASPTKLQKDVSAAALKRLSEHPWRGNVRELKNVLARSLLLSSDAVLTEAELIFLEMPADADDTTLESLEKDAILTALKLTDGNRKRAAERLGIAKSTLFRKLKEYGLDDEA